MPNTDIWSSIGDNSNEHSVDAPEDSALLVSYYLQLFDVNQIIICFYLYFLLSSYHLFKPQNLRRYRRG